MFFIAMFWIGTGGYSLTWSVGRPWEIQVQDQAGCMRTQCLFLFVCFSPQNQLLESFPIGLLPNYLIISIARPDFHWMPILLDTSGLYAWLHAEVQCLPPNPRPKPGHKAGACPPPPHTPCTCALLTPHAILSIIKNRSACSLQCPCVLGILLRVWQLDWVQQNHSRELSHQELKSVSLASVIAPNIFNHLGACISVALNLNQSLLKTH